MTTRLRSRICAFLIITLISSLTLAISIAPVANAEIVAGQSDSLSLQADGAEITSPNINQAFDLGSSVTVKAKATYVRPEGFSTFSRPDNYIYLRVMKNNEQVGNLLKKSFKSSGTYTLPSFTPEAEGEYVIQVHHDYTYDANQNHVELSPLNFPVDNSRTIIVQKSITGAVVNATDKVYTGQPLESAPTVTLDGKTLVPGTDYEIKTYANNTNVGEATVTVEGKGFYKGTANGTFNITQANISKATMTGIVDKNWTRNGVTQSPTITWNGQQLVGGGTDYELTYANNTSVGTASVTATGKGNFTGSITKTFKINAVSICSLGDPALSSATYTGQPITQNISFWYGGNVVEGTDFTTAYKDNVNPGTATVTITGKGNFKDSMIRTFSIFEPSSSAGTGVSITAPSDKTLFAVGDTITVKATSGLFQSSVTWVGTSGPYMQVNYNNMYIRILRRDASTGATSTVKYERLTYGSTSDEVTTTFTADRAGEYLIQAQRDGVRINANQEVIYIDENSFNPTASILAYVGVTGPGAKKSIKNAQVIGVVDKEFTGNSITQNPTVKLDGKTLKNGTDYYVTYKGMYSGGTNTYDHGTVTMTIHGRGSYTDTVSTTFEILQKRLTTSMIVMTPASLPYTGEPQKPSVVLMNGPFKLSYTVEYDLDIEEGTEPGSYRVTATARENVNYTGSATAYYTIDKLPISQAVVTVKTTSYVYDGKAKKPEVSATLNGKAFSPSLYTVSYSNNTNAGTAKATITAKSDTYYKGSASATFTISPFNIADASVSVTPPQNVTYSPAGQTPAPTVKWGSVQLKNGTDFTLSYKGNKAVGTATVTISGKGNFRGSRTTTFSITPKDISDASITVDQIPYQRFTKGVPSTPKVTVRDGSHVLTSSEVAISYANNNKVGIATVTIAGKGNYKGSKKAATFQILTAAEYKKLDMPLSTTVSKKIVNQKTETDVAGSTFAPLKLRSVKQGKNYNVLSWNKVKGASRYEVYGSKCGKANKIKLLATVSAKSFKHKNLKKNTYYKYVVIAIEDTATGPRASAISKMIFVATKGGKLGNYSSLSMKVKAGKKVSSTKRATGKTVKLLPTPNIASDNVKAKKHAKTRFESSNPKVAKVNAKGVIKGMAKGTCVVYAYAQNGISAKVKVAVK